MGIKEEASFSSNNPITHFRAISEACPHHVSHYLGMDVHDTPSVSKSRPLLPGMVITIEPALYFPR